jgi:hypothetical protein
MAKQLHTNCCKKFLGRNFFNTIYLNIYNIDCHMTLLLSSSSNLFQLSIFCQMCRYLVRMVGASPPYRWINLFISHLLSPAPLAAFHFWLLLSSFLVLFFCGKWSPTLPLPCIISSQQLRRWATIVNQVTGAPSLGCARTGLWMNPNSWVSP